QGQRLRAMQQKNSQQGHQLPKNEYTNSLDVLTDVKTRWTSKKEGEKLERLCLNLEEREFLQQIIEFFAPHEEAKETFDTYLDLIYGSELANNNRNKTNSGSDYELPSGGSRQQ
ncbi:20489_t:CDS:2, partial [Gigaspora margarita]